MSNDRRMLDAALAYARRGLRVFPVYEPVGGACSCGKADCDRVGKHPRTNNGKDDATTDERTITEWWTRWPIANIGIPGSDELFFLDVDPRHGGMESLAQLETGNKIPDTVRVRTGGGGMHYYLAPNGISINGRIGMLPGIDIKSAGGYALVPPSLHASGARYEWDPTAPKLIAEAPGWLVDIINDKNGSKQEDQKQKFDTGAALDGVEEGRRDETLFKLACKLRAADVPMDKAAELVLEAARKCSPPFPEAEARAKVWGAYGKYKPAPAAAAVSELLDTSGISTLTKDSKIDDIQAALQKLAGELRGADRLKLVAARENLIRKLEGIKVRAPAALADAALSLAREDSDAGPGIAFEEPKPWPEPVVGAELLTDLSSFFCRYAVMSSSAAATLALWTVHTYALDAAFTSPIITVTSPEKRCGKTLVLELLGAVSQRPLPAANLTAALVFRVVDAHKPTLLIDEADTFLLENEELRGVINSGHRRGGFVWRCVGDDNEPRQFSTWCPKAIALIGNAPDTIQDRSIIVRLSRKGAADTDIKRMRYDRLAGEAEPLRSKAARWAADNLDALKAADPQVPVELNDRAQDNWRPLIAIADCAGGFWSSLAREAALELADLTTVDADGSARVLLLQDIRGIFKAAGEEVERIASEEVVRSLVEMEERPWPEWGKGKKPLSKRGLARLLRPFGIVPTIWRDGTATIRGYDKSAFRDVWGRYTPTEVPPLESKQSKQT
jgi:putative DNA primase/helicase